MTEDVNGPAVVESVIAGSPAERVGIEPGDRILTIDGSPMRDAIDFSIIMESDVVHNMDIERSGNIVTIQLEVFGEEHGINLESSIFGRLMLCNNDCVFCFVDQMPAGLRKTLYIKDDDYRLSFLEGNFITLTNLDEGDIERIVEDRLTPLYVSLHAFNSRLRENIFNNPAAGRTLETLELLLKGRIEVHIQVVLMKGLNDGRNLDETIEGLFGLCPGIASIGIVPVGSTSAGRRVLPESYTFDGDSSLHLIEQVDRWRSEDHPTGVYLADEFYFLTGAPPPEASYYDDYYQAENGIGLARLFIDSFDFEMENSGALLNPEGKAVVTSPMGAWVLDQVGIDGGFVQREICRNNLFGNKVTVCGLMPGRDIRECVERTGGVPTVLIPGVALTGGMFIDGLTPGDVCTCPGQKLCPVETLGRDLVQAFTSIEWGGL